ncbi:MAG: U32 family peptidase [Oscillospiraceae bacterium]|nr:U32 family peptidase [Oscillospiraceae bacterium]
MTEPELLAPAGDRERLEMALHYGADAVYLAGKEYGLRAAAGNFTPEGLDEAVRMSHAAGAKVYVTVNTLPHEGQLAALPEHLERCAAAGADGFIIADLGVMALAKRYAPGVPIHVSTQLGVVNSETARMLCDLGAKRVVLAREMKLDEIAALRAHAPREIELEAFVHGAMCVSFSGRCLLSNYMTGRDGNGGVCAQPCRWKYHLVEEKRPGQFFELGEDREGSYILNSRDLCMIEHLAELRDAGVDSFKIEGRMKSAYYAAAVTNAYRHALDDLNAGQPFDPFWRAECDKLSHRPYSTGFYFGEPGQHYAEGSYFYDAEIVAVVEDCDADGSATLTERNRFSVGEPLELLNRNGKPIPFTPNELFDGEGAPIETARHPMMKLKMRLPAKAERLSIVRRVKS